MTRKIIWIFILILVIFVASFYWLINSISETKTPPKKEEIQTVDYKKLEKLEGLKHPGESVKVDEPGYGRENPFAPY